MENVIKEFEKMEMQEAFQSFLQKEKNKLEKSNKKYLATLKTGAVLGLGSPITMLAMDKMDYFSGTALLGLIGTGLIGSAAVGVGIIGSDIKSKRLDNIEDKNFIKKMFSKYQDKEIKKFGEEEHKVFKEKMEAANPELLEIINEVNFKKPNVGQEEKIKVPRMRIKKP